MKICSWNIEHLDRLTQPNLGAVALRRRNAVVQEIRDLSPDILCVLEGPKGEQAIDNVTTTLLNGDWVAVKAPDGNYATQGNQWIWFLVRSALAPHCSLLPAATWDSFCGESWKVNLWGEFTERSHRHYRHPQVLVFEDGGLRVEFIGLHLKSKLVNQGESMWNAGGAEQEKFIREALTARIKMTTEATNVRAYIDARFAQAGKSRDLCDGRPKRRPRQGTLRRTVPILRSHFECAG